MVENPKSRFVDQAAKNEENQRRINEVRGRRTEAREVTLTRGAWLVQEIAVGLGLNLHADENANRGGIKPKRDRKSRR